MGSEIDVSNLALDDSFVAPVASTIVSFEGETVSQKDCEDLIVGEYQAGQGSSNPAFKSRFELWGRNALPASLSQQPSRT